MERKVTPKKLPTRRKKKILETFPLVEIIWVDAEEHGEVGWNCIEEMKTAAKTEPKEMKSVGYVLYQGEKHISLVGTVGPEECSTLNKIPTEFIREIRKLN